MFCNLRNAYPLSMCVAPSRESVCYNDTNRSSRDSPERATAASVTKSCTDVCNIHRRTVLWCSDAAAPGKLNSAPGRKRAAGADLVHKLAVGIRHVIQTETMGNSSQSQLVYKATHWSSSFAIGSYNSFSNL